MSRSRKLTVKSTDELKEILNNRKELTQDQVNELLPDVFELVFGKEYSVSQLFVLSEIFENRVKGLKKQVWKKGNTCVVKFEKHEEYYNDENDGFEIGEITAVNSKRAGVKFLNDDIPELNVPYSWIA